MSACLLHTFKQMNDLSHNLEWYNVIFIDNNMLRIVIL